MMNILEAYERSEASEEAKRNQVCGLLLVGRDEDMRGDCASMFVKTCLYHNSADQKQDT